MIVSVPTGTVGVVSSEYIPPMATKSDRFRSVVHGRIIFKLMSHCSIILTQFEILNESGVPDFISKNDSSRCKYNALRCWSNAYHMACITYVLVYRL